jgi:hypothetical protein
MSVLIKIRIRYLEITGVVGVATVFVLCVQASTEIETRYGKGNKAAGTQVFLCVYMAQLKT